MLPLEAAKLYIGFGIQLYDTENKTHVKQLRLITSPKSVVAVDLVFH